MDTAASAAAENDIVGAACSDAKDKADRNRKTSIDCNLCDESFADQIALRTHKLSVHKVDQICEVCGYVDKQRNINAHIRKFHPEFGIYKCELCDKSFSRIFHMRIHRDTHSPIEKENNMRLSRNKKHSNKEKDKNIPLHRNAICAICKSIIHTTHDSQNTKRTRPLPDLCTTCYTISTSAGYIQVSLDEKNQDDTLNEHNYQEDSYICGICRAAYPTKKHLLGHMGLHTQEASVECTLCRVGFTSAGILETHACLGPVRRKSIEIEKNMRLDRDTMHTTPLEVEKASEEKNKKIKVNNGGEPIRGMNVERIEMTPHEKSRMLKTYKGLLGLLKQKQHDTETQLQSVCAICKRTLRATNEMNMPALLDNQNTKRSNLPDLCKTCYTYSTSVGIFLDEKNQDDTLNEHNYQEDSYICGICRAAYPTKKHLLGHMCLHTQEASVECTLCRVGFTSTGNLETHACLGPVRRK